MPTCPSCEAEVAEGAKFCTFCGGLVPRQQANAEDPLIGRIFARNFRIEKLLGVGGMGKVYRAVQLSLDKPVVLKLLHQHYAAEENQVRRFHREARAASKLNHPNSIGIIDFGQDDDGTMFMAMEYLNGRDLFTVLQSDHPLGEERIARIVSQVCSALSEAHENGVIHRDLKPENIMVEDRRDQRDFVKVLDFGIAKLQDPGGKETRALTAQGMVCGTPEYMAPEQARGEGLDARTDIYALGVLLYQLVTGQLPFQADNAIGIVTKHIVEKPAPPSQAYPDCGVSVEMETIILKCMAKDPAERFQNVLELAEALNAIANRALTGAIPHAATGSISAPAATGAAVAASAPRPAVTDPVARTGGGRNKIIGIAAGVGVLAAAAAGVAIFASGSGSAGDGTKGAGAQGGPVVVAAAGTQGTDAPLTPTPTPTPTPKPDAAVATPEAADPQPEVANNAQEQKRGGDSAQAAHHRKDEPDEVTRRQIAALLEKGDTRHNVGDYQEALGLYQKARKLDPSNPSIHQKLGMAYYSLGEHKKACSALRTFLKLGPSKEEQKKYRPFLKHVCSGS